MNRSTRIALSAVCVVLAYAVAAQADDSPSPQSSVTAYSWQTKAQIPVRPLDDPANPHRGDYSAVDRWAIAHALSVDELVHPRNMNARVAAVPEKTQLGRPQHVLFMMPVDRDGWPVPFEEYQSQLRDRGDSFDWTYGAKTVGEYLVRSRSFRTTPSDAATLPEGWPPYNYGVSGEMPADVYREFEPQIYARAQDEYPAIPAWLGENPPLSAVFLPDGTLLCYGALGVHYAPPQVERPSMDLPGPDGETWYRYDRDGKLLEQRPSATYAEQWIESWNPGLCAQLRGLSRGHFAVADGRGFLVAGTDRTQYTPNPPTPPVPQLEALAAFDWQGQPLTLDAPLPVYPKGVATLISRDNLLGVYRAQLKAGLTTADSVSPYAGTPQGPVAVDPAPQPRPKVAQSYGGEPRSFIRVRPPDDPANPYAGQYAPWDRQAYEHANQQNPVRVKFYQDQANLYASDAVVLPAGQGLPGPGQIYQEPADSKWQTLSVDVDAQGWVIPKALTWQRWQRKRSAGDLRELHRGSEERYALSAEVEMEPADYQAYREAWAASERAFYPPVPQWLIAQPAAQVVFLPDGTLALFGQPGSFDPAAPHTPPLNLDGVWYRYSADGQLLGQTPPRDYLLTEDPQWLRLTFPGAAELQAREEAAGHGVSYRAGYMLVYSGPLWTYERQGRQPVNGPLPPLVAAYDWTGAPMDLSQPLTRPGQFCTPVSWTVLFAPVAAGRQ